MTLASKSIIPPREWYHDKYLTNNNGETVALLLSKNNINIPE